jgi:hypothetical protein
MNIISAGQSVCFHVSFLKLLTDLMKFDIGGFTINIKQA